MTSANPSIDGFAPGHGHTLTQRCNRQRGPFPVHGIDAHLDLVVGASQRIEEIRHGAPLERVIEPVHIDGLPQPVARPRLARR